MKSPCLFCSQGFESEVEHICSSCVQLLLNADQEDLSKAHTKAIEKGYTHKARAIESFLIPEEINVRKTKKSNRNMARKRTLQKSRPSRNELGPQPPVV